jgi:hypothetical protein
VTDRYKLFHFYEPEMNYWTLIDRQRDPNELKNVYDDPTYADTRRQLHAEVQRLRAELKVPAQDAPASVTPKQGPGGKKKGAAPKK